VFAQAFLEAAATRARASRSFAGGAARRWLTANGLELPAQIVNDVARHFAPGLTPQDMLRPHGGASGGGRRGCRSSAGGGRGGAEGVDEEEAGEDDDVPG
jgi:hypothetical protein